MIRILALPDPDSFLNLVNQSKGDVFLHLPGEGRNSLKKSRIAQQIIRLMGKKNVELCLDLSNQSDVVTFLQYMTEHV